MNSLVKKELTLDSREVAEMVGKRHTDLLRDIRTYEEYLGESNFAFTDFFIPSTYIESRLRGEEVVLENITRNLEKILEEEK